MKKRGNNVLGEASSLLARKKEREKRTGNRSKLVEGGLVILRLNFVWLEAKTKDFLGVEDC